MASLAGKVAIVTGANRGIGFEAARQTRAEMIDSASRCP